MALLAALPAPPHHTRHHHKHPVKHRRGCHSARCDRAADRAWARLHRRAHSSSSGWASAGASWYDDAGATACGTHYQLGVAHKTLPCGTRVELCYTRCAVVTVQDRGPFIAGREWDLNAGAKEATGFGDVGQVRFRVMR